MKFSYIFLLVFLLFTACQEEHTPRGTPKTTANEATQLLEDMVDELGGMEAYRALADVTFTYTYRDTVKGVQDVSTEKFLYDGELAWAEYTTHTKNVFPDKEGPVQQAWNGEKPWLLVEGNFIPAPPALRVAKFARNTAFFWFNMMYKLLDPGAIHKLLPNRTFEGKEYQAVEVTYGEKVGDAQDKFILYINPETKLVDQFLFTNMFFGAKDPRMMFVQYETVNGLKWPAYRKYKPADWEGNIQEEADWAEQISTDIQFNTGIERSLFDKPILTNIPMADLRNEHLRKGISKEDRRKGKALIAEMEKACGGMEKWKSYTSASFTQTADWYDNETNWTTNPQQFELTCTLGHSDGKLSLLNGPKKGMTWQIKNGKTLGEDGQFDAEHHEMVWHKQDYKSYWFQFPFKIREAEIISYAGQREIEGTTYDIVYATWHSEGPNSRYDQFLLYLHPETRRLEWLEFTIRDIFPMAAGVSQFTNYQEQDGLTLPRSQFLTQGTLDRPMKKLHENHYQKISFQ